jgi:hypothetical protein
VWGPPSRYDGAPVAGKPLAPGLARASPPSPGGGWRANSRFVGDAPSQPRSERGSDGAPSELRDGGPHTPRPTPRHSPGVIAAPRDCWAVIHTNQCREVDLPRRHPVAPSSPPTDALTADRQWTSQNQDHPRGVAWGDIVHVPRVPPAEGHATGPRSRRRAAGRLHRAGVRIALWLFGGLSG